MHFVEDEVCENDGADAGGEFTDNDGYEIIGVEGDGKREMSREDERAGNGERHIKYDALLVHLFDHADGGYVSCKAGDETHCGNIVDTDELAEEDQGLFQNLGEDVNERERTGHDHAGVDDGTHAFVVEGSHTGEKNDTRELGEDTDGKAERNQDLYAFALRHIRACRRCKRFG